MELGSMSDILAGVRSTPLELGILFTVKSKPTSQWLALAWL
jgi:hypothetical protein